MNQKELVSKLCKDGQDIINDLTPTKAHLWHMASCLCGETGELFDAIKKHVIYNKVLDTDNVVEELGDIEFYLEGLRSHLGIDRDTTLANNIHKLSIRYQDLVYNNRSAQERLDKDENNI